MSSASTADGSHVISAPMIFTGAASRDIHHQQCQAAVPPYDLCLLHPQTLYHY